MPTHSQSCSPVDLEGPAARAGRAELKYDILKSEGVTEIALKGGLGYPDHRAFMEVMEEFNVPAGHQLVFNLSKLETVDSSGLGMFLIANEEAKKRSLRFRVSHPRYEVLRVINLGKLDRILDVRP